MNRRRLLLAGLLLIPRGVSAQETLKVLRVGVLV